VAASNTTQATATAIAANTRRAAAQATQAASSSDQAQELPSLTQSEKPDSI